MQITFTLNRKLISILIFNNSSSMQKFSPYSREISVNNHENIKFNKILLVNTGDFFLFFSLETNVLVIKILVY